MSSTSNFELATFGAGCFWCVEAAFKKLRGVVSALPGYSGGTAPNPSYEQVCSGSTGHAEVVQVQFDPRAVSYFTLLEVFFRVHNPTELNRQGNDIGTQYRSAIFYHDEEQRQVAQEFLHKVKSEKWYDQPVVTELTAFEKFFPAEDYHVDYFARNPDQAYCAAVVRPKLAKFTKSFSELLRSD